MFGLISTKDLYMVQLACVIDEKFDGHMFRRHYDNERYVLAKKISDSTFVDIFTSTRYNVVDFPDIGDEIVRGYSSIITNKKNLTKNEAALLLKGLNDIYICENDNVIPFKKVFKKKKNSEN